MIIPRTFKQSIGGAICKKDREDYVLAEVFDGCRCVCEVRFLGRLCVSGSIEAICFSPDLAV